MSKKRLYISADIEGVAGVVNIDQLMPDQFEYPQARKWMTNEVSAACDAAFSSGIDEIVISDSHGNGQNLLLDELPANVQVVRSWPRPLCMMEGIQEGDYVGALLLGYHSGSTNQHGILAHTLHGGGIKEVRINEQPASETVISAATAAHFGVPVIMVSGDDAYIEHARDVLESTHGPIETTITKWTSSRTCSRTRLPQDACQLIGSAVNTALSRVDEFQAQALSGAIQLDIECIKRSAADLLAYLPDVDCVNSHTVRFMGQDMVEISRFLSFVLHSGVLTTPR